MTTTLDIIRPSSRMFAIKAMIDAGVYETPLKMQAAMGMIRTKLLSPPGSAVPRTGVRRFLSHRGESQ